MKAHRDETQEIRYGRMQEGSAPLGRRDFIRLGGLSSAMLFAGRMPVMAGPFTAGDLTAHLVPADKKLTAEWIASLTRRGEGEVFRGKELKYIGMPIGGIGCGQLYLAGDGRLWLWDIFKSNYAREKHEMRMDAMTMGGHYPKPVAIGEEYCEQNGAEVDQGFAIRVKKGEESQQRTLDIEGFPELSFRGEYPVGRVRYEDAGFPVEVQLEAFSPFVPLSAKDSALPVTVMRFSLSNPGDEPVEVELGGWLQNAVCPYAEDPTLGKRANALVRDEGLSSILSTIEGSGAITREHGYGSSALTVIDEEGVRVRGVSSLNKIRDAETFFSEIDGGSDEPAAKPLDETLLGGLSASTELAAGKTKVITFLISWYFPHHQKTDPGVARLFTARHYRSWFKSAVEVAAHVAKHREKLIDGTLLWNRAWYDSTLPHWLLDRAMIPLDCTATQTFHWFDGGRPWAWEGVDCCQGTCTHVFHYAQALARVFPELERTLREEVDYGVAFDPENGGIGYRGERKQLVADDGQAGTILRVYREHQMSPDDAFLKRLWPRVKQSIEYLMAKDPDGDGLLTGPQPHTLDAEWTGKISWLSSLYLAALAAGESMALELGDDAFAAKCGRIIDRGSREIVAELFDGEYFIHKPNKELGKHLNTNVGCHIDQVLGQAWSQQVGLRRVLPKKETVAALESLWKYNFAPDAGGYAIKHREIEQAFRWYAMEGEAGLLMTTFPKGGAKDAIPGDKLRSEKNPELWTGPGGYFNECMNGFEYQVAAHMVFEGEPESDLVERGLAIAKAVHERYGAAKRNPYNEIECSDHYARSMASYGVFLAACGFEYHGPRGQLGFAPKIRPDHFKAPFISAEGWGSYSQRIQEGEMEVRIELRKGKLALRSLKVEPQGLVPRQLVVNHLGKPVAAGLKIEDGRALIEFSEALEVQAGADLRIHLS
ncbi:GH116 family glycosyl-hydrolase [Haloferula chungangensis]|uniref:GH116 family glycosyl-hydrolase n=1 Tax=Haloferula chungangensis TaxID=1048331 RepID=A0ABW2LD88_9BACT